MNKISIGIVFLLLISFTPAVHAAAPKVGSSCSKVGVTRIYKGVSFSCVKSGKTTIWKKIPRIASPSPSPTPSPLDAIAARINTIFGSAPGNHGVFIKEVGGNEISNFQADFLFDPASSLKALVALYAFNQFSQGKSSLEAKFPSITSSKPSGCPSQISNTTETFREAIQAMMQVSDNDPTAALMSYFGAQNLKFFATSLGLTNTKIKITSANPGFNPIGCVDPEFDRSDPRTVSGHFSTLRDLTKIWESADKLVEPYRQQFMSLTAGKDMFKSVGFDFTGHWPKLLKIVSEEAPVGLSQGKIAEFVDLMQFNAKGGSNALCFKTANCTTVRWWVSMIALTKVPYCQADGKVSSRTFVWGYFSANSDSNSVKYEESNPALTGFMRIGAEPMREQIRLALSSWGNCNQ